MKQVLVELGERIDAMQLRERVLLLCAATLVLFLLFDSLGLQPNYREQKIEKEIISDLGSKIDALQSRTALLAGNTGEDRKSLRDRLHADLGSMESSLRDKLGGMLAPQQAVEVLKEVLTREQDLRLIEIDASHKPLHDLGSLDADTVAGIGRYGMQLQLEGGYFSTMNYLAALESLPWKFFWESLKFEVIEYPKARVTLDIYTLGLLEG